LVGVVRDVGEQAQRGVRGLEGPGVAAVVLEGVGHGEVDGGAPGGPAVEQGGGASGQRHPRAHEGAGQVLGMGGERLEHVDVVGQLRGHAGVGAGHRVGGVVPRAGRHDPRQQPGRVDGLPR
jgi:hypothetical protein